MYAEVIASQSSVVFEIQCTSGRRLLIEQCKLRHSAQLASAAAAAASLPPTVTNQVTL